jgi:hypothetical protein
MSNEVRDLLDRGAATPSADVDVNALVRTARERHRRRVGVMAGAVVAVVAVVVAAIVIAQPSSEVSIRSRPAASSVPEGWTTVELREKGLSLAIPPEWTRLDAFADEVVTVGGDDFERTGYLTACIGGGVFQQPATTGTWISIFEYNDIGPGAELELNTGEMLSESAIIDRPADFSTIQHLGGGCSSAVIVPSTAAGGTPSTTPPTGIFEYVPFRDAGRLFVARIVSRNPGGDRDLAYRVLNTLTVGDPGTAPTPTTTVTVPTTATTATTAITAPPPSTITSPSVPAGNVSDDEAAVRDLFLVWLNAQPEGNVAGIVEDYASIEAAHQQGIAQHSPESLALYSGRVDSVTIVDATHADVRYTILHGGSPQYSMMPGQAIKIDGTWMVSRETLCHLLTFGGITCPPRD